MITQTFDLNLIPNSAPVVVHVDQYDHGTGRLIAKLYNGATAYTPAAGATAMVQGKKPDGHGFDYSATISGSTVTMDLTEQMSIVAGKVCVQVVITEGSTRTGSFVFFLDVQPSALPADTDMSTSEYQIIEELLEEAQSISTNFPYIGANGNWWYYDVQQGAYVDSGVDASITITIGTTTTLPAGSSATVTNTGTTTDPVFNFGIPKGDTGAAGQDGTDGTSAGFGTPTASVDANVGTPSVSVSASGPDTAKVFDFQFHNLKGADGTNTDPNAVHWSESVGYVGKNKNSRPYYATSGTTHGITKVINADGTININNTTTGTDFIEFHQRTLHNNNTDLYLPIGDYVVTIEADKSIDVSKTHFTVNRTYNGADVGFGTSKNIGTEYHFSITENTTCDYKKADGSCLVGFYVYFDSGLTFNDVTIKPMIRLSSISDSTFEPWYMSNEELTKIVSEVEDVQITNFNTTAFPSWSTGTNPSDHHYTKIGHVVDVVLCGKFTVSGTVTLPNWTQLVVDDLPTPAGTGYVPAISAYFDRTDYVPMQFDYRNGHWGLSFARAQTLTATRDIFIHFTYISER